MLLGILLLLITLWLIVSFFRWLWKGTGGCIHTGTILDRFF